MIRSIEVIGVLNRYPFSSRVMDAQVPSSRRPAIFLAEKAQTISIRTQELSRIISGTIIDDDQFEASKPL